VSVLTTFVNWSESVATVHTVSRPDIFHIPLFNVTCVASRGICYATHPGTLDVLLPDGELHFLNSRTR
jgi:hypothetical protein